MPRPLRVIIPGCLYEITQVGNNGMDVFRANEDRSYLESLIKYYAHRYGIEIHQTGFAMNSIRLVVTPTDTDGLPRFMLVMTSKYARDFNKKYDRRGHLWQDRYDLSPIGHMVVHPKLSSYESENRHYLEHIRSPGDYIWAEALNAKAPSADTYAASMVSKPT